MGDAMVENPVLTEQDASGSNESELTEQTGVDEVNEPDNEGEETSESKEELSFAQMRHRIKELEAESEGLRADIARKDEALGLYFDGEDKELVAISEARGIPIEVLREARDEEIAQQQKIAGLEEQLENLKADNESYVAKEQERLMANDLAEIQKINPEIKELSDLPDAYFDIVGSGIAHGAKAYEAAVALTGEAPKPPGKAGGSGADETFFTKEQVEAMSREEIRKNMPLIDKSSKYW